MSAAQELTLQLQGHWRGGQGIAKCPAHEDHSPSLSIADGVDGRLLLHCFAGCSYAEIRGALRRAGYATGESWRSLHDVAATLPYPTGPLHYATGGQSSRARQIKNTSAWAERVWDGAIPFGNTLAEGYLRARGLHARRWPTLRYAAECAHGGGINAPALVAQIEGGDGFAIHRTYLPRDPATAQMGHKSNLKPNRKMLGPARGGAVRIANDAGPLVVAEGIETALSAVQLHFSDPVRVWAALSASGLRALRLPAGAGRLVICADGDVAGKKGAQGLAERAYALGWHVELLVAPEGLDWNDVLLRKTRRLA